MKNLIEYTPIELLKMSNDIKLQYEKLKKEIVDNTYILEEVEKKINYSLNDLYDLEKKYKSILDEINSR